MKAFNQISQSAVYQETDISVSITVCGGSYGGGSEVLVVNELSESNRSADGKWLSETWNTRSNERDVCS